MAGMFNFDSIQDPRMFASGLGGLAGGVAGLLGRPTNPADKAMPYLDQISGATKGYYDPYINAGTGALPGLQEQYGQLMTNPGGRLNEIGRSFQQSPGFKFALQQALQGANSAAAAGGMSGTPMNAYQDMDLATQLANQDYYNWLGKATGLYETGLGGGKGLAEMGSNASNNMANMIAQQLAAKAKLAYEGQAQQNQGLFGNLGNLVGGLGSIFSAFL